MFTSIIDIFRYEKYFFIVYFSTKQINYKKE